MIILKDRDNMIGVIGAMQSSTSWFFSGSILTKEKRATSTLFARLSPLFFSCRHSFFHNQGQPAVWPLLSLSWYLFFAWSYRKYQWVSNHRHSYCRPWLAYPGTIFPSLLPFQNWDHKIARCRV